MNSTLLLDQSTWDLAIDAYGNIAVAQEPLASAQDAASAIMTFSREVYFNTTLGIPYFGEILGHAPPASLLKAYFEYAAETVPDVVSAVAYLNAVGLSRELTGQVQVTSTSGVVTAANFAVPFDVIAPGGA